MRIGERVEERLDAKGISQSELARRVGVSQNAIWHLINKSKGGSVHLPKVARELGTTTDYLEGATDDPEANAPLPAKRRPNMIPVEIIDLAYGMGGTFLEDNPQVKVEDFPLDFLRHFTKAQVDQLVIAEGVGDSMAPTISPNDLVLVNRGITTPTIDDGIWACAIGQIGMIKRLRIRGENITILSDNPNVPDDFAADGELHIIGRVVGKFSRL